MGSGATGRGKRCFVLGSEDKTRIEVSPPRQAYVDPLAVSTDGWVIFAGFGEEAQLWNPYKGLRRRLGAARPISNMLVGIGTDRRSILVGTADGTVEWWDATGEPVLKIAGGNRGHILLDSGLRDKRERDGEKRTMSDLKVQFVQAQYDAQALAQRPDNDLMLKLYALYKQATVGMPRASGRVPSILSHARSLTPGIQSPALPLRKRCGSTSSWSPGSSGRSEPPDGF